MVKMTFTLEKLVCKPLSRLHNFLPNVLSKQFARIRHAVLRKLTVVKNLILTVVGRTCSPST